MLGLVIVEFDIVQKHGTVVHTNRSIMFGDVDKSSRLLMHYHLDKIICILFIMIKAVQL